jgi:hypothetical protein
VLFNVRLLREPERKHGDANTIESKLTMDLRVAGSQDKMELR